ncbi:fimbrial protein [Klebsiella spallanzanii]|uniref:fimbrial protein n=1 Tax=Klebsiella spallanzanii TaxID=2587528 RepID=UPI0011595FE5|nr:fimbrial protein [Klebsiella spallanzanii]VUS96353.1 hypothetical protein SB6419_01523 [Klebsiella spallanzanii]
MKIRNSVLTATILFPLLTSVVQANDGTIAVEGKITDGTCTVLGAAEEGGTPSMNTTIRLPKVSTAIQTLAGGGTRSTGEGRFNIHLKGCKATATQRNIAVSFSSANVFTSGESYYSGEALLNTAINGANGIGILINMYNANDGYYWDRQFFDNRGTSTLIPLTDNSQDIILKYMASYVKLGPVTAGKISTSAYYEIKYF